MFDQVKTILNSILDDKSLLQLSAKIHRQMFESLVEEGFTEEQAMQIVCSHSILNNTTKQ